MSGTNLNTRTADKQLGIEYTLCANGAINIRSDRSSGDVHTVHVGPDGSIEDCARCKGWKHHGHCFHTDYVRSNRPLLAAARASRNADKNEQAMTDGGTDEDNRFLPPEHPRHVPEDEVEDEDDCHHINDDEDGCVICDIKDRHDDDEDEPEPDADVTGSEAPDFDRGPSGVDEL